MILIVGAGICGLATAKSFELAGIEFDIIDRAAGLSLAGAGIFLLGNATRALKRLDVLEKILPLAQAIHHQRIFSSSGKLLSDVRLEDVWNQSGPCIALSRAHLVQALQASLQRTTIRFETTLERTAEVGAKTRAFFSDGSTRDYDAIIGADGVGSRVRRTVFAPDRRTSLGITCWRFIAENTTELETWTAMLGNGRSLLAMPISPTQIYVYADYVADNVRATSFHDLKQRFADFKQPLGHILARSHPPAGLHSATLTEVPVQKWVAGNTLLIGDAAHACSPSMAQGAAMALEDAVALADQIVRADDIGAAFEAFYAERLPRLAHVQKQSRIRDRLRYWPAFVRNVLIRRHYPQLYRKAYASLTEAAGHQPRQ